MKKNLASLVLSLGLATQGCYESRESIDHTTPIPQNDAGIPAIEVENTIRENPPQEIQCLPSGNFVEYNWQEQLPEPFCESGDTHFNGRIILGHDDTNWPFSFSHYIANKFKEDCSSDSDIGDVTLNSGCFSDLHLLEDQTLNNAPYPVTIHSLNEENATVEINGQVMETNPGHDYILPDGNHFYDIAHVFDPEREWTNRYEMINDGHTSDVSDLGGWIMRWFIVSGESYENRITRGVREGERASFTVERSTYTVTLERDPVIDDPWIEEGSGQYGLRIQNLLLLPHSELIFLNENIGPNEQRMMELNNRPVGPSGYHAMVINSFHVNEGLPEAEVILFPYSSNWILSGAVHTDREDINLYHANTILIGRYDTNRFIREIFPSRSEFESLVNGPTIIGRTYATNCGNVNVLLMTGITERDIGDDLLLFYPTFDD